jgi:hypothetical protein
MIRLTTEHPDFQRLQKTIDEASETFAGQLGRQLERDGVTLAFRAPQVARAQDAFRRREMKHYGLTGKYVGH